MVYEERESDTIDRENASDLHFLQTINKTRLAKKRLIPCVSVCYLSSRKVLKKRAPGESQREIIYSTICFHRLC